MVMMDVAFMIKAGGGVDDDVVVGDDVVPQDDVATVIPEGAQVWPLSSGPCPVAHC